MGEQLKLAKLSASIPSASRRQAEYQLTKLNDLIQKAVELSEEIGIIVANLRGSMAPKEEPFIFTTKLAENEKLARVVFRDCDDVVFRSFYTNGQRALLIYLEGMADTEKLEQNIIGALMKYQYLINNNLQQPFSDMKYISEHVLQAASVDEISSANTAVESVMLGNAILLVEGIAEALSISCAKFVKRNINEPVSEHAMKGPNEAFNEVLSDNLVLLRRRSKDANVKIKNLHVGKRTKTSVALVYVANLVKPGLLEEVERRIARIKVDKVIVSANIEEFIVDHPWSPFPQVQPTERPDKIIAGIYEGRVGILVDGSPACFIVPCTYNLIMQAVDDYTINPIISSVVRLWRQIAAFLAIYLPGIYISIVSYHPGMLPTTMAISIAELRARTPFPSFLEVLMMELLLELFQEAIVRLPNKIASAASMVGAFVIGTTVVQAGLINPLLVVVIAATAIASYSMPSFAFSRALRLLRIPVIIIASVLGLYGVVLAMLFITVYLISLHSFGESYLGSLLNISVLSDWKDSIVRLPNKLLRFRPISLGAQDKKRVGD